MSVKFIYTLLFLFLFSTKIPANIIYVPGNYSTIQEAIDHAIVGDTVLVLSGTYTENIDFLGKDIIVASQYLVTENTDYIFQTIIQGENGSVVTFNNGESNNAILCGFTITEGTGTVLSTSSGNELFGGGIFIKNSSPTIKSNVVINNDMITGANRGGGIAIKDSANPLIFNNTITANDIVGLLLWINYFGGGIWVDSTSNPIISGDINYTNNIYLNSANTGYQAFRDGSGNVINAQYNYWGICPPSSGDVFPLNQFDVSNCLVNPVGLFERQRYSFANNFYLSQNFPNPFNPSTTIKFTLPKTSDVTLKIFNILGEEVATLVSDRLTAGSYSYDWPRPAGMASGVYLYRLEAGEFVETKKMILIK